MEAIHRVGKENDFYLLTLDLEAVAQCFVKLGFEIPDSDFFANSRDELVESLEDSLEGLRIVALPFPYLKDNVETLIGEAKARHPEAAVIAACHRYFKEGIDDYIFVNRVVDVAGSSLGIGQRLGSKSVTNQVERLKKKIGSKPIIFADDGSFNAETTDEILELFDRYGLKVICMVFGITFPGARKRLFGRETLTFLELEANCLDWLPERDFYPLLPDCGKVIGSLIDGCPVPLTIDGLSLSMPYIHPYGDPVDWASIPSNKSRKFSEGCMKRTIRFFEEMERLNGGPLLVSDIRRNITPYRISLPLSRKWGMQHPTSLGRNVRIVDILTLDLKKIEESAS